MANEIMSVEGQLVGMPLAGPESFSQQQLDYLKRALGVDETVLYDKSDAQGATLASPAISLSESIFNFERIKIYWKNWNSGYSRIVNEFDSPSDNVFFNCMGAFYTSTSAVIFVLNINKNADGTALNFDKGTFCTFGNTNVNNASNTIIYKVVGVGRIAGGN